MPDQRRHRGPHPDDVRLFGAAALPALQTAAAELSWLLSRGIRRRRASSWWATGMDWRRGSDWPSPAVLAATRRPHGGSQRQAAPQSLGGASVQIDGYNVLTTIEAALAGGVLLLGRDGALRDMASMHGSYRKVEETSPALRLIGQTLRNSRWPRAFGSWIGRSPTAAG